MADTPRLPDHDPAVGGASPRRVQPRNRRGVFCKAGDEHIDTPPARSRPRFSEERTATPAELVARVTRAIEGELAEIENIMHGARVSPAQRTEGEKRARTLASLARTLAEVTKLREATKEATAHHDDDAVPRDLDEFRRTLERRLAQVADASACTADRGDEPCGDDVA